MNSPDPGSPPPKPRIALVDDDASILTGLSRLLRASGYAVNTYSSAREFLESLPEGQPDCLVLDVQMPGINGFELQARLGELGHKIPILFITAFDSPQTRAAARQTGCLGLFFKPFEAATLLEAIKQAVAPKK